MAEQKEVRNRLNESLKQKLSVKRIGNITNAITVNKKIFFKFALHTMYLYIDYYIFNK